MIGHPYVVTSGIIRFILRIFLSSGLFGPLNRFGEYLYRLPGIDRSVEAMPITGFLLIGRNKSAGLFGKTRGTGLRGDCPN